MSKINLSKKPKMVISLESQRLWYGAMLERYNSINKGIASIDTKMSVILAATVTMLLFAVQDIRSVKDINLILAVGICMQVIAVIITIIGIRVGDQHSQVNLPSEQISYSGMADDEFISQLVLDLEYAITSIERINGSKFAWFNRSLYGFLASSFLILISRFVGLTVMVKLV